VQGPELAQWLSWDKELNAKLAQFVSHFIADLRQVDQQTQNDCNGRSILGVTTIRCSSYLMDNGQGSDAAWGAGKVLKLFHWSFELVGLRLGGSYVCRWMGLENPFLVDELKLRLNRISVSCPSASFTGKQEHAKLIQDIGWDWIPLGGCHTTQCWEDFHRGCEDIHHGNVQQCHEPAGNSNGTKSTRGRSTRPLCKVSFSQSGPTTIRPDLNNFSI